MKKVTISWIIAAFCILRITELQPLNVAPTTGDEVRYEKVITLSADDIVVSGRWMR